MNLKICVIKIVIYLKGVNVIRYINLINKKIYYCYNEK